MAAGHPSRQGSAPSYICLGHDHQDDHDYQRHEGHVFPGELDLAHPCPHYLRDVGVQDEEAYHESAERGYEYRSGGGVLRYLGGRMELLGDQVHYRLDRRIYHLGHQDYDDGQGERDEGSRVQAEKKRQHDDQRGGREMKPHMFLRPGRVQYSLYRQVRALIPALGLYLFFMDIKSSLCFFSILSLAGLPFSWS